jgi:hypothetical protein
MEKDFFIKKLRAATNFDGNVGRIISGGSITEITRK